MTRRLPKVLAPVLLALLPSLAEAAQLSKETLLEMADGGVGSEAMVAEVERHCVDFTLDAAIVAELAGRVPRQVLMAAIDCAEPPPESKICRLYRALAADSRLADYPVVILWYDDGDVGLLELSSSVWLEERGGTGGLRKRFRAKADYTERHRAALEVLQAEPGVRSYVFQDDDNVSSSELAGRQRLAILDACSRRARVLITSDPPGASVRIDGEDAPDTPFFIELLPDEHILEVWARGHAVFAEPIVLSDGERREIHVVLEPSASLEITSEPPGAIVVLDGTFAGHTPVETFVEPGRHRLRVLARGRPPHEEDLAVGRGELITLEVVLAEPAEPSTCVEASATGPVSKSWKALGQELAGSELELLIPLYEVVSSTMEREVPSTHVLDARRVLFKPGTTRKFVERPRDLMGLELGGSSFGETAIEVLESAPGRATIVGTERKRSTLRLDLVHHSGDRNALFLDFSRDLESVDVRDVLSALCLVAVR